MPMTCGPHVTFCTWTGIGGCPLLIQIFWSANSELHPAQPQVLPTLSSWSSVWFRWYLSAMAQHPSSFWTSCTAQSPLACGLGLKSGFLPEEQHAAVLGFRLLQNAAWSPPLYSTSLANERLQRLAIAPHRSFSSMTVYLHSLSSAVTRERCG